MPLLRDFERRLEGLVEGFFARAFRSGVQPVELGRRILREMEANRTVGVREVWVPNRYVLYLAPSDRERFEGAEGSLASELRRLVRDGAEEREWKLVGPAEVVFETDESLGPGRFRCEPALAEPPDRPATGQLQAAAASEQSGPGVLSLITDGTPTREFPLDKDVVTIGRLADCEIPLDDPGVSRRHAQIRMDAGGYTLIDLASTNGTMVNEATISEHDLRDGDRITIGQSVLEFRRR